MATYDWQQQKYLLEERLKSSDARIKRLEDQLHQQHDPSRRRTTSSPLNSPWSQTPDASAAPSPSPYAISSSPPNPYPTKGITLGPRRPSYQSNEERNFARRIVSLEADLMSQKKLVNELEKDAQLKHADDDEIRAQLLDANTTKQELLANLKAQQQEATTEKKILIDDANQLRNKIDQIEDELDRVLGSRDNERFETTDRLKVLEDRLDTAEKAHSSTREERDGLRSELQSRLDRSEKSRQQSEDQQSSAVKSLMSTLRPHSHDEVLPEDLPSLVRKVDACMHLAFTREAELKGNMNIAQADRNYLRERLVVLEEQLKDNETSNESRVPDLEALNRNLDSERTVKEGLLSTLERERAEHRRTVEALSKSEERNDSHTAQRREQEVHTEGLNRRLPILEAEIKRLQEQSRHASARLSEREGAVERLKSRLDMKFEQSQELTTRLHEQQLRLRQLLEALGLMLIERDGKIMVQKVPKLTSSLAGKASTPGLKPAASPFTPHNEAPQLLTEQQLGWMFADSLEGEKRAYADFIGALDKLSIEVFSEAIARRVRDAELIYRRWRAEAKKYRERAHRAEVESHDKIAYRAFKEGDLALFLPTRNQITQPWAAFNVGAPHYFLREQESHRLRSREWLLARIAKVEERVVDLSKPLSRVRSVTFTDDANSVAAGSEGGHSVDDENPFELSDGLRWYLLDAGEEKPGAPSTPGQGKSTVASTHVDATGSISAMITGPSISRSNSGAIAATKNLHKSLESRRSSNSSLGHRREGSHGHLSTLNPNSPKLLSPPSVLKQGAVTASPSDSRRSSMIAVSAAAKEASQQMRADVPGAMPIDMSSTVPDEETGNVATASRSRAVDPGHSTEREAGSSRAQGEQESENQQRKSASTGTETPDKTFDLFNS